MSFRRRASSAPKPRTREQRETALLQRIVMSRSIDDLDAPTLAMQAKLPVVDVMAMLEGEKLRRRSS